MQVLVCYRRAIVPLMMAACAFAIGSPVAEAQRTPPSEWKWVDKNIAKGCQHATLFSDSMQRDIGYSIYLPPSYKTSPNRRYPVVYYLHGASGSESSSREFAWAVQKGIAEGVIAESIYVFPNGGHYSGYRDWDDGTVKAETWIIRELIPHIDATYRTIATRDKRALCGWSMGGGGSLRFLTKYPDMFCAAATLGAALNMRGSDPDNSAIFHAKKNADKLRGRTGIWMAVGADDRFKAGNESFSATLKELDVEHSLIVHSETGHNLGHMSAKFHRDIVLMLDRHLTGKGGNGAGEKAADEVRIIRDQPYKSGDDLSDYERERCKLDWYLPANETNFPTLIWFHGGGLRSGHKADDIAATVCNRFAAEGIAVASVNYRLSPMVKYPAYTQDAAAAVAFVRKSVAQYGGSPASVFVSGHSAGGYLTSMVGMHPDLLAAHDLNRTDIAGYVPVAGQMVTHSTVRRERGIPRSRPIIDEASPAFHATADTSPFLCFAGDNDLPARSEENRYFAAVMKAAGHKSVEFIEVAGRDHGTVASRMGEPEDDVALEILQFIKHHRKDVAATIRSKVERLDDTDVKRPAPDSESRLSDEEADRPNILFILSDDHATQAISCYGGYLAKYAQTTNIDRLASDGVRLTNCFCSNSICTPSRASILTGQYSHRNGVYLLNQPLPKDAVTFPALMGKAGYKTGVFGKWHLISRPQGFDEYMVLSQQGRYKNPQFVVPGSDELVEKTGWSTDVIADLTMDFIRRRKQDQPFLAMCHFKTTHDPWDSREPHKSLWKDEDLPEPPNLYDQYEQRGESVKRTTLKLERINQGTYPHKRLPDADWKQQRGYIYQQYIKDFLRCGRVLDENVGRLLQFLEDEGLSENTIVVYTSDQGHFLGEHGFFSKRFMYDESIHMPFIIRFPDKSRGGQVVDDMISNVDFAPTMLDIAGVRIPESMQGRSFLANLQGKTPADWPDAIYYHYWQHLLHRDVTAHYGIRTKDAKLIFYYGLPLGMTEYPAVDADWEYFDLSSDPHEMHNRYGEGQIQPTVDVLKQKLDNYRQRVGDLDSRYPELQRVRETTK